MLKFPFLLIPLVIISNLSYCQTEKIDTDRPDQTESAVTVPKKWFQFETGVLKQTDKQNSPYKDSYFEHPALLSKYGLTDRLELRLITTYATIREENVNHTNTYTGLGSVQFGGKFNFFNEKGARPKTSLIAHYDFGSLRTGPFNDSIDGINFRFTMQNTLSDVVSLGYNLGVEWDRFGSLPAYIYTFAPGFNINDDWYAYIEMFGFIYKNEKPQYSIDGGIAYYLSPNFKLDLSSGLGISKSAPDWYIAVGGSFRFKSVK